jgi:hypothetical protein
MIKEHVYEEAANAFGTSVGVAHVIGFKNKKQQIKEEGIESFKSIEPELEINYTIIDAIEIGKYQELQRAIFKLKNNKRIKKETTLYNKAFNEITNG